MGIQLYCTEIDGGLARTTVEQMKRTCPQYDYMTHIDNPPAFAKKSSP